MVLQCLDEAKVELSKMVVYRLQMVSEGSGSNPGFVSTPEVPGSILMSFGDFWEVLYETWLHLVLLSEELDWDGVGGQVGRESILYGLICTVTSADSPFTLSSRRKKLSKGKVAFMKGAPVTTLNLYNPAWENVMWTAAESPIPVCSAYLRGYVY